MDVSEEMKFLRKFKKKNSGWGVGWGVFGLRGQGIVNEELKFL